MSNSTGWHVCQNPATRRLNPKISISPSKLHKFGQVKVFLKSQPIRSPTRLSHKSPRRQAAEADLEQRLNDGDSAQAHVNLSSSMHSLGLVRLNDGSSGAGTPLFAVEF